MCLNSNLGWGYDAIISSKPLFEGLAPINEVKVVSMIYSADPDETPRFAASHLGLRCLQMLPF